MTFSWLTVLAFFAGALVARWILGFEIEHLREEAYAAILARDLARKNQARIKEAAGEVVDAERRINAARGLPPGADRLRMLLDDRADGGSPGGSPGSA